MLYTLCIRGAPGIDQSARTALEFAEALLRRGHKIAGVFFFAEAVLSGLNSLCQEEVRQIIRKWERLKERQAVELMLCSNAALRRGVVDEVTAERLGCSSTLSEHFHIVGLGVLMDALRRSDRFINFG